jgi:hypothetical protein
VHPGQGGTHVSAEAVIVDSFKHLIMRLERSEPNGRHTVLVFEAVARESAEEFAVISLRLGDARTFANHLHELLAVADEVQP